MIFESIQMNNGTIFNGEKIGALVQYIVNKFSTENLTYDEATKLTDFRLPRS